MALDAYGGHFMGARARVTFDVPAGWSSDGKNVYKEGRTASDGPVLHVGAIGRVNSDPCKWSGGSSVDPLAIWSVEGTALALTSSWPDATGPNAVTVGGLAGMYVEVKTPGDFDAAICDYGQGALFEYPRAVGGRRLSRVSWTAYG